MTAPMDLDELDRLIAAANAHEGVAWAVQAKARRELAKLVPALIAELRMMRRATADLATRGHGVRRPKWLVDAIDAAIAASAREGER